MDPVLYQEAVEARDKAKRWGLTTLAAELEAHIREQVRLETEAMLVKVAHLPPVLGTPLAGKQEG